jgi:hypothetical protein
MRFFKPELYVRFNSVDDDVADMAFQEWEAAAEQYAQSLAPVRDRLPSQIRKLTELSLHDALILSRREEIQAGAPPISPDLLTHEFPMRLLLPFWTAICVVTVKDEYTIRSLIYCLRDGVRTQTHRDWPFSKEGEHWLYDELEVLPSEGWPISTGGFLHRVLLSSGVELEIPFTTLFIHEFSLAKAGQEIDG